MLESIERKSPCCPISTMLKVISPKWTVEILRELSIKPTRTRQFLNHIPGLTMKCLQERLKCLESAGLIRRVEYKSKVPRVEHQLTERGSRVLTILMALKELGSANVECICPMENNCNSGFVCPTRSE